MVNDDDNDAEERRARLLTTATHLAAIADRGSARPGEREAAEWIAQQLRVLGHGDAVVETERAHGGYWTPIALLNALALLGALTKRRALAALAVIALVDDLDHRGRWFRRAFLPRRATWNVTATAGAPDAPRTVVVVAHHDAAHGGAVFDPTAIVLLHRHAPALHARITRWPPLMWGVVMGPLLVLLGRPRRLGPIWCAGAISLMFDVARSPVSPGANDNASAVAVLLELARRPVPEGLRVFYVSTGSEESNSEGMQAWGHRHFPGLDRATTTFIALETLGSGHLVIAESEGFLVQHAYDPATKDRLTRAAAAVGVEARRGAVNSFASDGQIPLHAGYPSALLGALDDLGLPRNYHQAYDTADALDLNSMADAVRMLERFLEHTAASG